MWVLRAVGANSSNGKAAPVSLERKQKRSATRAYDVDKVSRIS